MTAAAQAASGPEAAGRAGGADGAGRADGAGLPRGAQPRQLIVTVYGLYSRAEGGWLSVASLITLLAELGVDQPAVRSSISRLKRRGILQAQRRDGAAGYALSDEALAILREGDHRIFRRQRARLADGWLLAVFSVPETERHKRHLLRSQLARLGFGTAAPGMWIAPAYLLDATTDMLRRLGLDQYAELFRAEHLAFGEVAGKVRQWWDLDLLERFCAGFLAAHGPLLDRCRCGPLSGRDAFAGYVRVLTEWRRIPYLDPGLPAELLPENWAGIRAAGLFFTLQSLLEKPAQAYVTQAIRRQPSQPRRSRSSSGSQPARSRPLRS